MNSYEKILTEMDTIEKDIPLEYEYSSDGRYHWPDRWALLRDTIKAMSSQQPVEAEADIPPVYTVEVVCKKCGEKGKMECESRSA